MSLHHIHDFRHPYRGFLMCTGEECGEIVNEDGTELTFQQSEKLLDMLCEEYGRGGCFINKEDK